MTGSLPYPPLGGGALRSYGIIDGLARAGHAITLFTFGEGDAQDTPLAGLCEAIHVFPLPQRSLTMRLRDLLLSDQPDLARRLYSTAFADKLRQTLAQNQFELIQADGLEVAVYLPLAKAAQPDARLCYDSFNAEYDLQAVMGRIDWQAVFSGDVKRLPGALYSGTQVGRIKRFESTICRLSDLVIAVSPEDAAGLSQISDKPVGVVPNGIFVDQYADDAALPLGDHALVFTGTMDYRPNVDAMLWFCERVLPLVQQQIPAAQLYIVGQRPSPRLMHLADRPGVQLTGKVPDVKPYLRGAGVYIVPMRMGGGTRLKVLEAMAAGCAVVSTTTGASGLQSAMKHAMIVADDPARFAAEIVRLLRDPAARRALGGAAREQVRAEYDWSVLIPKLLALYKEIGLDD